ncbi:copper oxidase [Rhodococcus sp. 06-412-2C]|uniref:multicopper oxidase family protein n=1 Tax=unclassified Rhodococcus (in: high G+C Gram-positive bacteria) TaxID=192944 RepID=UPI000B9AEAB8|nr:MULTISPECIES: multicopper oxidase domain-containing protein [unclassified Rhodococcus (in: high G+C Gram-positive bacteria)]OZC84718.1 copper oxidase [Rhodococcus sp. 06-412-2C]OZC98372.1 copper oxidase [Rhodococcus sp. 06-412-2B]
MSGAVSRRTALRGLAAAAVAAGAAALPVASTTRRALADDFLRGQSPLLFHSPPLTPFRDELPRLPLISGTAVTLDAHSSTHAFHADLRPGPTFGYGQCDYLGPTIESQQGQPWTLKYSNTTAGNPLAADIDTSLHGMSEMDRTMTPTSLHLHGSITEPASDGHSEMLVRPGESMTHNFPGLNDAAGLWYHDHAMSMTRINVYAGLLGMNLVRDRWDTGTSDNALGLPSGEFELPLVLQEKIMNPDGSMSIRSNITVPQGKWEGGGTGDVGVVNGKIWPTMEVARGMYRLRLVNAGSYSVWNLFFTNKLRFWVIGNDGGLLDAPVETTSIRLAPAERADVLVDFGAVEAGALVELLNDEPPPAQAASLGAVPMPMFCQFRVASAAGFRGGMPSLLRGGKGQPDVLPPLPTPTSTRTVTVNQPSGGLNLDMTLMNLNNLRYSDPDIEMPKQGTVEMWNIVNTTVEPHPIHLHLAHFRTLGRIPIDLAAYQRDFPRPTFGTRWAPPVEKFLTGPSVPPATWEAGWKDTVNTYPGTVTQILVRFPTADELGFDPDATFAGPAAHHGGSDMSGHDMGGHDMSASGPSELQGYMWHCHMLDHEDHEMMLRYRTVAP